MKVRPFCVAGIAGTMLWAALALLGCYRSSVELSNTDSEVVSSGDPVSSDSQTASSASETDISTTSESGFEPTTDEPDCDMDGWKTVYPPHGAAGILDFVRLSETVIAASRENTAVFLLDLESGAWESLPAAPGAQKLVQLWGRSRSDLYALTPAAVLHFDGAYWKDLAFPEEANSPKDNQRLFGDETTLYVFGWEGGLYGYRDGAWSELNHVPSCPDGEVWTSAGTSDKDVYVIQRCDDSVFNGQPNYQTHVLHWNGAAWVEVDKNGGYIDFVLVGEGEAWGRVLHKDPAQQLWHYQGDVRSAGPAVPQAEVIERSLAADAQGNLLLHQREWRTGVGEELRRWSWNGETWQAHVSPSFAFPKVIEALGDGEFLVGEERGRVSLLRTDAQPGQPTWRHFNGEATSSWIDIWGSDQAGWVAAGADGILLRGNGYGWRSPAQPSPVEVSLAAVAGTAGGVVMVGGRWAKSPLLWCDPADEGFAAVDLSTVPGNDNEQRYWQDHPCDEVIDIAAVPDAERFFALCRSGWILELDGCDLVAAEPRYLVQPVTAIAAGLDGLVFVSEYPFVWYRRGSEWNSAYVREDIKDLWTVPGSGETAALASGGGVYWWADGVFKKEIGLPLPALAKLGGTARDDVYAVAWRYRTPWAPDPGIAHFDGEHWRWKLVHSYPGQQALAAMSAGLFMASRLGNIGWSCGDLY